MSILSKIGCRLPSRDVDLEKLKTIDLIQQHRCHSIQKFIVFLRHIRHLIVSAGNTEHCFYSLTIRIFFPMSNINLLYRYFSSLVFVISSVSLETTFFSVIFDIFEDCLIFSRAVFCRLNDASSFRCSSQNLVCRCPFFVLPTVFSLVDLPEKCY